MDEKVFMSRYAWKTILSLYMIFNLKKTLRLRNVDRDLVLPKEISDALSLPFYLLDILHVVNNILRKFQRIMMFSKELSRGSLKGKIDFKRMARYYPRAMPILTIRLTSKTASNILLVATIIDIERRLCNVASYLKRLRPMVETAYFKERILKTLNKGIGTCRYILSDPMLKPLIPDANLLVGKENELKKLEDIVENEIKMKPKELYIYSELISLRRKLMHCVSLLSDSEALTELSEALTVGMTTSKLYELFGFSMLLESIMRVLKIDSKWNIHVDSDGRVLTFEKDAMRITISYNMIPPDDIKSILKDAEAYGIINGPLDVKKLGGIPDTIVIIENEDKVLKVVVDYKYSRQYQYLVQARFKALSYIYEFNADTTIIVTTIPENIVKNNFSDEEESESSDFYRTSAIHGGAWIEIDDEKRFFIIAYIEPREENLSRDKEILDLIIRDLLSKIEY